MVVFGMKTPREEGEEFEKDLANRFGIKTTAKSGAHWDNADLSTHTLLIEAKVRHEPFFKPSKKELEKLIAQASKHCKDWAYIQKTDGGTFVVCDLEFFTEATEAYFND